MTSDMAFECLLVSQDPSTLDIMGKLLADLAIFTSICPTLTRALDHLSTGETDLVILDCQKDSSELLQHLSRSHRFQKTTVMLVSDGANRAEGTYSLLRKPITVESGARSLRQAYSKLIRDYRRYTRYPVMQSAVATNHEGRSIPVTVTDIGKGGLGLNTQQFLLRGDLLSFPLLLSGTEVPIDIQARVLWMRQYGAAGCEFAQLSQTDRRRLDEWLEQKCPIKKPLVDL